MIRGEAAAMTVGVVGAGTMGCGIAGVFAVAGHRVAVFDADEAARERALDRIAADLEWAASRGAVDAGAARDATSRIVVANDLATACGDAGLVVEAIAEDLPAKRALFKELDACALPGVLLATNTSALSISAIAAATGQPGRVLGLHFFNPPLRMPLVEIVRALGTDQQALEEARAVVAGIGKQATVVRESPGFATSRISAMVGNEAFYMLQEGVASAEDIDRGIRLGLGHPMGPLELGDLVGLDVRLGVLAHLYRTLGDKFRPCPLLVQYVDAGWLGRKTRRGVYRYDQDGKRIREPTGGGPMTGAMTAKERQK